MPYIEKPIDRNQVTVSTLDDMVEWNSIARVIDCFVDSLDLEKLGFTKAEPAFEGRPSYDPQSMLKLYLYGYRKNIRTSRKLASACTVNIEVMWMLGGLKPDFRTVSDFRKDNIDRLKAVFKEFVRRVTVDLETGFVSIDGSKFEAWNGKDRNFTIMKLDDRIKWLEDHALEYLRLIEAADLEEDKAEEELVANGTLTREQIEAKLQEAQKRLEKYRAYRELMEKENLTQLSLTDADARLMKDKNGMEVSYNVQTAVDSETHLILDYQATNQPTDHGQMAPTLAGIKEDAKEGGTEKIIESVADKGYQQPEDMVACLENGIIPHVILLDGQDEYELEVEYEEASDVDVTSTKASELKKCLHAGVIPDAYGDVIKDAEVVEVRKRVSDEPQDADKDEEGNRSPYGTEEEMKTRAGEGYYVRDPERNLVYCPGGEILRQKCIKKNGSTRYANRQACSRCPYRNKCVTGNTRWKEIDFGKDSLEREAKWWDAGKEDAGNGNGDAQIPPSQNADQDPQSQDADRDTEGLGQTPEASGGSEKGADAARDKKGGRYHYEKKKVVRFKLRPDRGKMDQRKSISEHPFGTIKRWLGASYFLLKGKRKVGGEFALIAMGYNISRAENMFSFEKLMGLVGIQGNI